MACDPKTLNAAAACFQCLDEKQLRAIQAYLLCLINNNSSSNPLNTAQAANTLLGGPTSGAAALPSFRALVGADFGSQSANLVLASPNGSSGSPAFRQLVGADLSAIQSAGGLSNNATYTNNATPANVSDLTVNVNAGGIYAISAGIYFATTSGGTGGNLKMTFGGGSATATNFAVGSMSNVSTLASLGATALATAISASPPAQGNWFLGFMGTFLVNAGGTLIVQASQVTSGTNTTTLYAGSWLRAQLIK